MVKPLELGAMFPFLPEGRAAIRTYQVTMEDLVVGRSFEAARKRGWARAEVALKGEELADLSTGGRDPDLLEEILSYLYARMIVSAVNDPYLTRKFCLSEAKLFEKRLVRLNAQESPPGREAPSISPGVGRILDHLKIPHEVTDDGRFALHFSDYLRLASQVNDKHYVLAGQDLRRGIVRVPPEKGFRLFEEAYRLALAEELPISIPEAHYRAIEEDAERLAALVGQVRAQFEGTGGVLDEGSFPPCIKALLEMTGKGQNVPHMGRFTLVAFLHTIGYEKDGMVALFSRWPDFNVDKSMYQILHITGESSGTEYTPPTCSTMKTYGICFNPDTLCGSIRHPLSYYRKRLWISGKVRPTQAPDQVAEADREPDLIGDD